jgi:hypothetical protein
MPCSFLVTMSKFWPTTNTGQFPEIFVRVSEYFTQSYEIPFLVRISERIENVQMYNEAKEVASLLRLLNVLEFRKISCAKYHSNANVTADPKD